MRLFRRIGEPWRRAWKRLVSLTLAACVALGGWSSSWGEEPLAGTATDQAVVESVDTVGLTVADMDRAVTFYADVLLFEQVSDVEVAGEAYEHLYGVFGLRMRVVTMRLGDESITLTDYLAPEGRPFPQDTRSNDRWFQHVAIVTSEMARAYQWLRAHHVQHASSGPQRLPDWNRNAGGIEAFYFRDPDGHFLEILHFPDGKGDPKWQRQPGKLFLGIDHTALVVSDTEASLRFYAEGLGLRVAGGSENYGTEQEHLNNVFGARLRITTLRAASGPGIELLEYLAPRDGRPIPSDQRANDVAHWQTRVVLSKAESLVNHLRRAHAGWVSPGMVTLPENTLGMTHGALVRDPDGHVMEVIER